MDQEKQQKEIVRSVSIPSRRGLKLAARIHGSLVGHPVLVIAHGMMSSKSSPRHLLLAQEAMDRGMSVVRFDFAGCGNSQGSWPELTPLGEVDDLLGVLDYLKEHQVSSISLYGSSLGGWVSLQAARQFPVQAVATWAAVTDFKALTLFAKPGLKDIWQQQGYIDFRNGRVPYTFHEQTLGLKFPEEGPSCPCFIAHGTADEVVPFATAQLMAAHLPKAHFVAIPDGDHRLLDMSRRTVLIKDIASWLAEKVEN